MKDGRKPGGPHVLVLEDEAHARTAMALFLQNLGYRVSSAATADEAVALAERAPPDVLVCDWKLEREQAGSDTSDGVGTAAELQRRYGSAVIMVTAYRLSDVKSEARAAELEVSAYYRKPLSLVGLARAISGLSALH